MTDPGTGADHHDVIVVGAGACGAVVAAERSRDPQRRVLLLEAGPDRPPGDDLTAALDVRATAEPDPRTWVWEAQVAPDRRVPTPRGRVVGGSLAVNGGYAIWPRIEDLTAWAEDVDDPAWRPAAWQDSLARLTSEHPGWRLEVTDPADRHPAAEAFERAATELGATALPRPSVAGPHGVGPLTRSTHGGRRVTTATTHLDPVRDRPNLAVRPGVTVRRVRFEGRRAVGVEVRDDRGGTRVLHGDEVVLCAGAIATPALLLRSGVGPADDLRAAGIEVVTDLPGVGRGLGDHPDVWVRYALPDRWPVAGSGLEVVWHATSSAPSRGGGDLELLPVSGSLAGFLRGPAATTGPARDDRSVDGVVSAVRVGLQQPVSRGEVRLDPADPDGPPRVVHRAAESRHDRQRLAEGVAHALRALTGGSSPPLPASALLDVDRATWADRRALDAWVGHHLGTAIHACGTCRAGRADDPAAVADARGRVRGLEGVTVLDTSLLPTVPSRGPAAAAVLLAAHLAPARA